MIASVLDGLRQDEAVQVAARSRAFGLFAAALGYPEGVLLGDIREGRLADALGEALYAIDPALGMKLDVDALRDGLERDELAIEHTRLFDVGMPSPPCPLNAGLWAPDRMKTMEEALRFYRHFGLCIDEAAHELPDHLTTELEFLHYLGFREAEACEAGTDNRAYRDAQRDFIERHPGRWVPMLRERLAREEPPRFTAELFRALEQLLEHAHATLARPTKAGF